MGEWIGKVRSTPTPKETLRTVKVRPTPEPCSLITTPWKTWTRERLPSTTFTCTLMVSPARKSGTSSRLVAPDSSSMTFDMLSPRDCHRSPTDGGLLIGVVQAWCRPVVPLWQVTATAGPRSDSSTGPGVRRNRDGPKRARGSCRPVCAARHANVTGGSGDRFSGHDHHIRMLLGRPPDATRRANVAPEAQDRHTGHGSDIRMSDG